jgi:hypothetical protein
MDSPVSPKDEIWLLLVCHHISIAVYMHNCYNKLHIMTLNWACVLWASIIWTLYKPTPDCGPGCSVGIATDYGLDGPGIESRWGRDFSSVQTGPGAHPASCTMGAGSFLGVKCGRGVTLTTNPLLAPRSWKSRAIPLPPSGPQPGL